MTDNNSKMQDDPQARTQRLHAIMRENRMKAGDVATLLGRDVNTVRVWRSKDPRTIPAHTLELLEMKLAAKQAEK